MAQQVVFARMAMKTTRPTKILFRKTFAGELTPVTVTRAMCQTRCAALTEIPRSAFAITISLPTWMTEAEPVRSTKSPFSLTVTTH